MIRPRRIIAVVVGMAPADVWLAGAEQEPPVSGEPRACSRCPLRRGGEWEEGARAALAAMSAAGRARMCERWGCHAEARPCAGMRRLVRTAEQEDPADPPRDDTGG